MGREGSRLRVVRTLASSAAADAVEGTALL